APAPPDPDRAALEGLVSALSAPRPAATVFPPSLLGRRLALEDVVAASGPGSGHRSRLPGVARTRRPEAGSMGVARTGVTLPGGDAVRPARRAAGTLAAWAGRLAIAGTALALVATLLLVFVPMVLPVQALPVLSGSMTPTIPVGSLAFVTRTPIAELKVGDVISFQPPGRPGVIETHRIISLQPGPSAPLARTQGDANRRADPWLLRLTGSAWRYDFSIPHAGAAVVLAKSGPGRVSLLLVPGLALVLLYLAEFVRGRPARRRP
ncbi:MAG: signal peptidase I, partial [Candidatus Dormibacterales bacterium]